MRDARAMWTEGVRSQRETSSRCVPALCARMTSDMQGAEALMRASRSATWSDTVRSDTDGGRWEEPEPAQSHARRCAVNIVARMGLMMG